MMLLLGVHRQLPEVQVIAYHSRMDRVTQRAQQCTTSTNTEISRTGVIEKVLSLTAEAVDRVQPGKTSGTLAVVPALGPNISQSRSSAGSHPSR